MNFTLETTIKNINLPKYIKEFWDRVFLQKANNLNNGFSGFISRGDKRVFQHMEENGWRLWEIFNEVSFLYRREVEANEREKIKEFVSLETLRILEKENITMTNVLLENNKNDPLNEGGWNYPTLLNLYLADLKQKKEKVPSVILELMVKEIEKDRAISGYKVLDEELKNFIDLVSITEKEITYNWFSKNLQMICMVKDQQTDELEDHKKYLNFDSQKLVFNYIKDNFPLELENAKDYYQSLFSDKFTTKEYFQGEIDINLYVILNEKNLSQKDYYHLINIAEVTMNNIQQESFMSLIGEQYNIEKLEIKKGSKNLLISYSSINKKDIEVFEKVAIKSLNGVYNIAEKIQISSTETGLFSTDSEVITNLDVNLTSKQYLKEKLSDELSLNSSPTKKMKL
jgi:hypothetical protein